MRVSGPRHGTVLSREVRPRAVDTAKTSVLHYVVDARLSRFTVQAFAGGFLSAFAHSPKFAIRGISSEVRLDPDDLAAAALRMEIRADSIQLLDEVSDKDRREIERVMREEALEAAKYSSIAFVSASVSGVKASEGQYSLMLEGGLALHGVTRPLTVPLSRGPRRRYASGFRQVLSEANRLPHQAGGGGGRRHQGQGRVEVLV
jgi:polyisoprenoid-binding protein YceI